jgi:hypothetical protein
LGRAALTTLSRVDLPALGTPMMPTSATSLSSNSSQCSSPGSPFSATLGAVLRAVLNAALPRPPRPPRAITISCPAWTRSASTAPLSASRTRVPAGTGMRRSGPAAPYLLAPRAVHAPLRAVMDILLQVVQGVDAGIDVEDDVAAATAVAAGRSAARDIFLAPKGDDAVAAVACLDKDACSIKKHKQSL